MFDYFEAIYCINLDEEQERWEKAKQELNSIGIGDRLQRFSAVKDPIRGRGASRSHLELIKLARQHNLANILIFEDDTKFINWNDDYLKDAIAHLPADWQLFNIGYNICASPSQLQYERLSQHLIKIQQGSDVRSNNAYAVNSTAFTYIIDRYSEFLARWQEDKSKWHLDLWYAQNCDRYCLIPLVSVQQQGEKPQRFIDNFAKQVIK
jgi:GR25 family glycosyltransferase involved in LPS biosynthesis